LSVHVIIEYRTKPGRAEELTTRLGGVLPDVLRQEGCEGVRILRNQGDPTNVITLSQWATRGHYERYLAWRTQRGDRVSFEEILDGPMAIRYYDEVGVARR
jgi:quinol monooxygenase YgiN